MTKAISAILERDAIKSKALCDLIGVITFVALTAIGAYIRIPLPFTPVPITLQTFFVILAGAVLGGRLGSISQAAYVCLGVAGLPVFQDYGYGITHLAGPTGGYLAGFILTPVVIGKLLSLKNNLNYGWILLVMMAGSLFILLSGTLYLMGFLNVKASQAFALGMLYFIPGDFVKAVSAASIYKMFLKVRVRAVRLS